MECLLLFLTAHCLPYQVHPGLCDPRRSVRCQRTNETGEILDSGYPPRDQPQASDQTFETTWWWDHQAHRGDNAKGGHRAWFLTVDKYSKALVNFWKCMKKRLDAGVAYVWGNTSDRFSSTMWTSDEIKNVANSKRKMPKVQFRPKIHKKKIADRSCSGMK